MAAEDFGPRFFPVQPRYSSVFSMSRDKDDSEDDRYPFGRGVNMDRTGIRQILKDHLNGRSRILLPPGTYRLRPKEDQPKAGGNGMWVLPKSVVKGEDPLPVHYAMDTIFQECENVIGRRFNSCLMGALSCSRYTNPEEAILEHGRSILYLTVLLYALSTKDVTISSLLLKSTDNMDLANKFKDVNYVLTILKADFNLPDTLLCNARKFTDALKKSGLISVPAFLVTLVSFLWPEPKKGESTDSDGGSVYSEGGSVDSEGGSADSEGGSA